MRADDYQEQAMAFLNPKTAAKPKKAFLNGVLGLVGEAGEVADYVKKVRFQGREYDAYKVADEVGDVLWYAALLAESMGFTLGEIMSMNLEKLQDRYPNGFTVEASENRSEK